MKKMFSIKPTGFFGVEEDGVYSVYDKETNTHRFLDESGDNRTDYKRPATEKPAPIEPKTDDGTFVEDIGQGLYLYSTHPVEYDMDGRYGRFGIQDQDGNKRTEEIYYQVGCFFNGLCSVRLKDSDWGCINQKGELVIPYQFADEVQFNKYGVAVGDDSLIDRNGNEIPDTRLNAEFDCFEYSRYYTFSLLNEDQCKAIEQWGTAPGITMDVYDTKRRKYVVRAVPEGRLDVSFFDGEHEVVLAAAALADDHDLVTVHKKGTILARKDGRVTVYDYYQNDGQK